tara:strand:+ start:36023 stop:36352 length:330 start_codon:yes stop_codon:yes gene_type:complete
MRLNPAETGSVKHHHSREKSQVQECVSVSQLGAVQIEIAVLLGRSKMPIQQFLRMGRGAVIPLDSGEDDQVWILANNHPIARGDVVLQGDRISITITGVADANEFFAAA